MTFLGWVFMIVFWASIIVLNIFCFSTILKRKDQQNVSKPPENDP